MTNGDEQSTSTTVERPARRRSGWTAGRVVGLIFAAFGGLIGLLLLAGGIALLVLYAQRDDGYFTTDRQQLESPSFAIESENIDLGADEIDWAPSGILGNVRLRVESNQPVFVGIGRDRDVDRYLGAVSKDQLVGFHGGDAELVPEAGRAPRTPPGKQGFWVAEAEGSGQQALSWDADFGRWTAVVMNADGTRGIDVEADAGVKLDWAIWVAVGLLVFGLLLMAGALAVILIVGRGAGRSPTAA